MYKILSFQHINNINVTSDVSYILIFLLSSESNACFVMTAHLDFDETKLHCSWLVTVMLDSADGDVRSYEGFEANEKKCGQISMSAHFSGGMQHTEGS